MTGVEVAFGAVAAGTAIAGAVVGIGEFVMGGGGHVNFAKSEDASTTDLTSPEWEKVVAQFPEGYVTTDGPTGEHVPLTFTKHAFWGKGLAWKPTKVAISTGGFGTGTLRVRIPLEFYIERTWVLVYDDNAGEWRKYPHITRFRVDSRGGSRGLDSAVNKYGEEGKLTFSASKELDVRDPYIRVRWELKLNGRNWCTATEGSGDLRVRLGDSGGVIVSHESEETRSYLQRMG